MKNKLKRVVTTVTTSSLELDSSDIIALLNSSRAYNIPSNATVMIEVPSGGDYSGEVLDLLDYTITVVWTIKETKDD